jgi:hypothetical protein
VLEDCIQAVLRSSLQQHTLRQWTSQQDDAQIMTSWVNRSIPPTRAQQSLQLVYRFWRALWRVCQAADPSAPSLLHVLAQTNSCPELIAKLVLVIQPQMVSVAPLPLHVWCRTNHSHSHGDSYVAAEADRDGLLAVLLQAYPQAAAQGMPTFHPMTTIPTNRTQLPLIHALLVTKKPTQQLDLLWRAHPAALGVVGKRLPVWAHLALTMRQERGRIRQTAGCRRPANLSLFDFLSQTRRQNSFVGNDDQEEDNALRELDQRHLSTLYSVMRELPATLLCVHRETVKVTG